MKQRRQTLLKQARQQRLSNPTPVVPCTISHSELWRANMEQLHAFVTEHNYIPTSYSATPAERKIGSWVYNQKKYYKNRTNQLKTESNRRQWEQFVAQHHNLMDSKFNIQQWTKILERLKAFIETTGSLPSTNSTNLDEKRLGKWIYNQGRKYNSKCNIMTNPVVVTKWEEFIDHHPGVRD